jgi:thiamine biosynthesis lipoprotein
VDKAIVDMLLDCKAYYELTGGRVNAAMGSVLRLWHEAREDGLNDFANAYLPDGEALAQAAEHADWDDVLIDEEKLTVTITDPGLRLDVGAIAKGWSVQRAAETAPEGLLISVGGNVCATGPKDSTGTPWVVGVQDPDGGENYLHTLYLTRGSMVTSGDYQRAYMVDGELYHHIIDPDTLYPGSLWRAVTVVCPDSGLADALSTALFLLPMEEGQKLLDVCESTAMWVDAEGNMYYSTGFEDLIRT